MQIDEQCPAFLRLAASWWWLHDFESNTIQVSESISHSLGFAPSDVTTPKEWSQIVHESDLAQLVEGAEEAERSSRVVDVRVRYLTKGGRVYRTMLCRMQSCVEDGVAVAVLGVNREIDDILAIEEEILRRNEDLAQVASVLSHDFRGPARHILGCTERVVEQVELLKGAVAEGRPLSFKVLENWVSLLRRSGDRLGKMIEHVLQYSRAGTKGIEAENIDSAEVVEDVVRDYADRIVERNAQIKVTSLPAVYYDRTMLYLLLANLISNAIKFSKKNDPAPVIEIDGRSTVGEWAAIAVRDYGIGFPSSQRERILDMGFRLHHESEYAGFGYGLAIVRRILNRGGGELGVRSRLGEGSEFVLKLPAARLVRS